MPHRVATDWEVIALARKPSDAVDQARFISVDLLDPRDCHDKLGALSDITHVFYAAYKEQPTETGQVAVNGAMLRNLVEVVEAAATRLGAHQPDAGNQGLRLPVRTVQDARQGDRPPALSAELLL